MKEGSKGQKEGRRTGAEEKVDKVPVKAKRGDNKARINRKLAYRDESLQKPTGIMDVMGRVSNHEED